MATQETKIEAATKIQAAMRGLKARKEKRRSRRRSVNHDDET